MIIAGGVGRLVAPQLCDVLMIMLILVGCGEIQEVPAAGDCLPGDAPLFPLAVGNWWIYRVTDNQSGQTLPCKANVVVGVEPTDAGPVFEIEKRDMKSNTSWLLDTGTKLVWLRKRWGEPGAYTFDFYDPFLLRLDYRDEYLCSPGTRYSDMHEERRAVGPDCAQAALPNPGECPAITENVTLRWTVIGTRECTVRGLAKTCYCVNRQGDPKEPLGDFCFARGIGKVSEKADQTEELVDYCVDGAACPDPPAPIEPGGCK